MFHIVEDDHDVSAILSEMIEEMGHATLTFDCPEKYINHINSPEYVKPVATFTDIRMPVMNGFEMITKISATHPDKKFIIMSGNAERYAEFKDQVCMYLCKPFHTECLEKILAALKECHYSGVANDENCATAGCYQQQNRHLWACPKNLSGTSLN